MKLRKKNDKLKNNIDKQHFCEKQNLYFLNIHLKPQKAFSHKMLNCFVCYPSVGRVTWVHPVIHCVNVKPHPTF